MGKSISTAEMPREQWLVERKRGIGASEVAAVLGLNPYRTAYQVWEEKVSPEVEQIPENAAMHFGNKLEQVVADEFAERTGRTVRRDLKIRIHPEHGFLFCSLDRTIVALNGEGPGVLECKTASSFATKSWESEIPPQYFVQVQAQLAVTGYTWGVLALLIDGRDFRTFEIKRDEDVIRMQTERLVEFWQKNVCAKVPPPMVVADISSIGAEVGTVAEADDEMAKQVQLLASLKAQKSTLEAEIKKVEGEVKLFIGSAETLAFQGQILATWKQDKPSVSFDAKRFKAENPDIAAKYEINDAGSRRFILKSPGKV
jgi:putative phage-type endonuclease